MKTSSRAEEGDGYPTREGRVGCCALFLAVPSTAEQAEAV